MNTKEIELSKINTDGGTQARERLDQATVREYAEVYQETPDAMPALTVYWDGSSYWLANGFHRYHAALTAGLGMLDCEIVKGSIDEARWHAAGANATHGLRRSNADKRRAVEIALANPKSAELSNRVIAEHCGVGPDLVGDARRQLTENVNCPEPAKRVGRDGKQYAAAKKPRETQGETAAVDSWADSEPEPDTDPQPWPGDGAEPDESDVEFVADDSTITEYDSPVKSLIRSINQLKIGFTALAESNPYTREFFGHVVSQDFDRRLDAAANVIKAKRPWAVCGHCEGKGCEECGTSGVLPKSLAESIQ